MKNEYENLNRKGKSNLPRIKDIREECYDYFVENNLEQIVKLVKVDNNDIDENKKFNLIDQIFTFFTN